MPRIRYETPADIAAIYHVNQRAFETRAEAELVSALRRAGKATISLVAVYEARSEPTPPPPERGRVRGGGAALTSAPASVHDEIPVGHILFSPVTIECAGGAPVTALGLAPMAVVPELQRRGIGSALVRVGLDECRRLGHTRIVVLGHPHFYRHFGFRRAGDFGLRCEYDAPEEAFMALELAPQALTDCGGVARYAPEFDAASE